MSDDSFMDFRAWLISRGRAVYETVLADPDALADAVPGLIVGEGHSAELYGAVAAELYEDRCGESPPNDFERCRALVEASIPAAERALRDSPLATAWWEDDDSLERLYPRLAALVAAKPPDPEPEATTPSPEETIKVHRFMFVLALSELVVPPLELRQAWYVGDTVVGVQVVGETSAADVISARADYDGWTLWLGHGRLDEPLAVSGIAPEPGRLDIDEAFDRAYEWFAENAKRRPL
jgi:hypothetical protein